MATNQKKNDFVNLLMYLFTYNSNQINQFIP